MNKFLENLLGKKESPEPPVNEPPVNELSIINFWEDNLFVENYILDENHNPVICTNAVKWAGWFSHFGNRLLKKTMVGGGVEISTVFLGIAMGWRNNQPFLFETMIFGGERDLEEFRYTSWDEALEGHEKIVQSYYQRCKFCDTLRENDEKYCTSCGHSF